MKRYSIVLVMVCVCLLFVSVYLYKDLKNKDVRNKGEVVSDYLSQKAEEDFTSMDGIRSAYAIVSYDEAQDQYSIELSLITDEDINEEQAELYKNVLRKTYVDAKLTINGVLR